MSKQHSKKMAVGRDPLAAGPLPWYNRHNGYNVALTIIKTTMTTVTIIKINRRRITHFCLTY